MSATSQVEADIGACREASRRIVDILSMIWDCHSELDSLSTSARTPTGCAILDSSFGFICHSTLNMLLYIQAQDGSTDRAELVDQIKLLLGLLERTSAYFASCSILVRATRLHGFLLTRFSFS